MRKLVVVWWLLGASAGADPLAVRNAEDVRVSVAQKARHAWGLKPLPGAAGWQLELRGDADGAEIIDVTPGTPARTLSLAVAARVLRFDPVRFVGGHVYQVQLRGAARASSGLVYLYPDAAAKLAPNKGVARVRFDADERATDDGSGIERVDKGKL